MPQKTKDMAPFPILSSQLLPLYNPCSSPRSFYLNLHIGVAWSDWPHPALSFHDLRAMGPAPAHSTCVWKEVVGQGSAVSCFRREQEIDL